jgi:hypothetical protein
MGASGHRKIGPAQSGARRQVRRKCPERLDEMLRDIQSIGPDRAIQCRRYLALQSEARHSEFLQPK